jgi:hypothetical protein
VQMDGHSIVLNRSPPPLRETPQAAL